MILRVCCHVILIQMVEVIKEQLYHSNVVNGMYMVVHNYLPHRDDPQMQHCDICHHFTDRFTALSSTLADSINGRISTLEQKVAEWPFSCENMIQKAVQQVRVLLIIFKSSAWTVPQFVQ